MKAAYKQADGKKIDNRRVLVDVERGRTVPNWRPRRLGGGLGTTRVGNEDLNQRSAGREQVQSGGTSRSEEPRIRDDRESYREKSRERGGRDREREREKSRERSHDRPRDRERSHDRPRDRERSHDRPRDREHRDEKHHKDRDRNRDREKDRGRGRDKDRDRDRAPDRERGKDRDRDRDNKEHERDRHRSRDRDRGSRDYEFDIDNDRGRSRDRDYDYDHEQDRHGEKERNYDPAGMEDDQGGWYEQSDVGHRRLEGDCDRGHYDYYDHHHSRGEYDNQDARGDDDRYKDSGLERYEQMEEDDYAYDRAASEPSEKDRRKSDRPSSREYEY